MEWGIEVILKLRQILPGLDTPFEIFTFMGNEMFFLLLLPLVYWCLSRPVGVRLTILFLASVYLNMAAKSLLNQPRPFEFAPDRIIPLLRYPVDQARAIYGASGSGFPSGHTQNAVIVWGYLASQFKRKWLWVTAGLMMLLIPLSRVYLAMHFPHDILGGYALGAILLFLYLGITPGIEKRLTAFPFSRRLAAAIILPMIMIILFPHKTGVTAGATLMGMAAGFVLERHQVGFDSEGEWWRRVLRYLLGIIVLLGLYVGLKAVFAGLEPKLLFRFIRYAVIGFWGGVGGPWVFVKLRLAKTTRQPLLQ